MYAVNVTSPAQLPLLSGDAGLDDSDLIISLSILHYQVSQLNTFIFLLHYINWKPPSAALSKEWDFKCVVKSPNIKWWSKSIFYCGLLLAQHQDAYKKKLSFKIKHIMKDSVYNIIYKT